MTWKNGSARPSACQAQGRARWTLAAARGSRQRNASTVFSNACGQVVGAVRDGWLTKRVDTRVHQLRKPPAWCIDRLHLDQLEALGAVGVLLIDEQGTEWRATREAFRAYGLSIDRGHGVQVALPLARWRTTVAGQLSLFCGELVV